MRLAHRKQDLHLRHVFTISRSSGDLVPVTITEIEREGIIGLGEAPPNSRYGETTATGETFSIRVDTSELDQPFSPEQAGT